MAITIKQQPTLIKSSKVEDFYTYISNTLLYNNYHYVNLINNDYDINNLELLTYPKRDPFNNGNLVGYISTNKIIDNLLKYTWKSGEKEITKINNEIICTALHIQEINNNAFISDANSKIVFYKKSNIGDFTPYLKNDSTTKLILNKESYTFPPTTNAIAQAFYGKFDINGTLVSDWNKVKYSIRFADGTIINAEIFNNHPYIDVTNEYNIYDSSTMLLAVPFGPVNITNNTNLYVTTIELPNGVIFYVNNYLQISDLYSIDSYTVQLFKDSTPKSILYNINIEKCNKNAAVLTFRNLGGGEDKYIFNYYYEENSYKNYNVEFNDYEWYDDYQYQLLNQYDTGLKSYKSDNERTITLISDYIPREQILQINQINDSQNVMIQINGEEFSGVIDGKKTRVIEENKKGRIKFKITVKLKNKKVNI